MPAEIDPRHSATSRAPKRRNGDAAGPILIGLVNNMSDAAVVDTEQQFVRLLSAASGSRGVRVRLSQLPGIPRGKAATEAMGGRYWSLGDLLADPPDALIVTGAEPRTASLRDEPYWNTLVETLSWAEAHTVSSIWSCLAAHALALHLDGVERRRLPEKLCGVYSHGLAVHPLTAGLAATFVTPHSRWNDLPVGALRAAGYTILSESPETGANVFVRRGRSLLVCFQGHPEYESGTLLKEYRRDVRRFLEGRQNCYPSIPAGTLPPAALPPLRAFQAAAMADREAVRPESLPLAAGASHAQTRWRRAAVGLYRNWISFVDAGRRASASGAARQALTGA